jgi:Holliday junction resolvasome RuvABC endonuclease subunit
MLITYTGVILAFDQSLARTGWALLTADVSTQALKVSEVGMLPTEPGDTTGFEDSFTRGVALYASCSLLIEKHAPSIVVHEMPAVRRERSRNQEAPFVSAMSVRCAASKTNTGVVMLNAQQVKKRLTGNAKADKKDVRLFLMDSPLIEGVTQSELKFWNSDVFDAMALAVVYATQEKD